MKSTFIGVILSVFLCIAFLLAGCMQKTQRAAVLSVDVLKIGKADASVFRCGDTCVVIDCGEAEDGEEVVKTLKAAKVDAVDLLIITHFDKDHVGGAPDLLEQMTVKEVFVPDYEGTSAAYRSFAAAIEAAGLQERRITEGTSCDFGNVTFLVEPSGLAAADMTGKEIDNDMSLVTTVIHGEVKLLFAGDVEAKGIQSWLSTGTVQEVQLLKLPHHGRYNQQTAALLDAVTPQEAVICSSDKNPAEQETLAALNQRKIRAWETRNGDISITSDGISLTIGQK